MPEQPADPIEFEMKIPPKNKRREPRPEKPRTVSEEEGAGKREKKETRSEEAKK